MLSQFDNIPVNIDSRFGKVHLGSSSSIGAPIAKLGFSVWIENGEWFTAPMVDPDKYGAHAYESHYCPCGCYMGSSSSSGPINPFGPCPLNPLPSVPARDYSEPLPEHRYGSSDEPVIAERGKTYGDPLTSHTNIGLSWTGLLQQHYGITLPHAIPAHIVALMMVTFKAQRSCRVYKEDNYVDLRVYAGFAEKFDKERKLVDER